MINLLLGAPGSGKSYEAVVFHVLVALQEGRRVITNLPLNLDEIAKVEPRCRQLVKLVSATRDNPRPFSTSGDYGDEWREASTGRGALYVIDECHKALPRNATQRDVEEWYAEHRHEGADVLLITQSYGKVSKAVIDLVQVVYRVRKNVALGSTKSYTRKVQDGIRGEVMNTSIRHYQRRYFRFYTSHTKTNAAVMESMAKDVRPIWRHWSFYCAFPCLLFVLYGAFHGWLNPFPDTEPKPKPERRVASASSLPSQHHPRVSHPQQQVAAPAVKDALPETKKPEPVVHPFARVQFHISGHVASVRDQRYLFVASQNGQPVFRLFDHELRHAGYTVTPIGPCIVELAYQDYRAYVICDAPRVGVNIPAIAG